MTSAKGLVAGTIFLATVLAPITATALSEAVSEAQAVPLVATAPCNDTSTTGLATSPLLAPLSGHSIHLADFDGVVYYTVERDGYQVVATLASGAEERPIRFLTTLAPGQRMLISVPRQVGEPSLDFEIVRAEDDLVVGYATPCSSRN
jgi:hypothetical protein